MREIQDIVQKLDVNPPLSTSRIHVYRLKNAQALEMVQVLNNLLNGGSSPSTLSPSTGKGSLGRSSFNQRCQWRQLRLRRDGRRLRQQRSFPAAPASAVPAAAAVSAAPTARRLRRRRRWWSQQSRLVSGSSGPASASSAGKSIDFSYPVNITADPATNAMVVSASPQDWQTLTAVIDDLDIPRVQMFVQAVIVEVSAERQRELGVNFHVVLRQAERESASASSTSDNSTKYAQRSAQPDRPRPRSRLEAACARCPVALASAVVSTTPARLPPAQLSSALRHRDAHRA